MSARQAILSGWLWLPTEVVEAEGGLDKAKAALSFTPKFAEPGEPPILLYAEHPKGYLGVPRTWGLSRFRHIETYDHTCLGDPIEGVTRLPDPNHPAVRNPVQQAQFMADLKADVLAQCDVVAQAATGSGKTVVSLRVAAELGRRTIILVHLTRLRDQWISEIANKLGVDRSRIGIMQGSRCDWRGKDFVVGMLQTLARNGSRFPPEFYRAFGTVIVDECHKIGTHFFAGAIPRFPAKYRICLSATPERSDKADKVFRVHCGHVTTVSEAEALPMTVYVQRWRTNKPVWGDNHQTRNLCHSRDAGRNAMIAQHIVRFYRKERQTLVIGESIEHLQTLMGLAEERGVPRNVMGLFTGDIYLAPTRERTGNGTFRLKKRKKKQTAAALAKVKEEAQIIFSTYGMMTEGIDIPRLDAGIDVVPRGKATQVVGRVRRPLPGKKRPVWVTILDELCEQSTRYFEGRVRDYTSTGAEVMEWVGERSS